MVTTLQPVQAERNNHGKTVQRKAGGRACVRAAGRRTRPRPCARGLSPWCPCPRCLDAPWGGAVVRGGWNHSRERSVPLFFLLGTLCIFQKGQPLLKKIEPFLTSAELFASGLCNRRGLESGHPPRGPARGGLCPRTEGKGPWVQRGSGEPLTHGSAPWMGLAPGGVVRWRPSSSPDFVSCSHQPIPPDSATQLPSATATGQTRAPPLPGDAPGESARGPGWGLRWVSWTPVGL